jgi:hypothetical protein
MIDATIIDNCINEMEDVIKTFLTKNGGYSNGYNTFVSGYVEHNVETSLEWSTPVADALTGIERRKRGGNLYKDLSQLTTAKDIVGKITFTIK